MIVPRYGEGKSLLDKIEIGKSERVQSYHDLCHVRKAGRGRERRER